MSWLVKPTSKCDARWRCGKEYYPRGDWKEKLLADIHDQNDKKLSENGCMGPKPGAKGKTFEIGRLNPTERTQHGIYWIHVGENSETCEVDAKNI